AAIIAGSIPGGAAACSAGLASWCSCWARAGTAGTARTRRARAATVHVHFMDQTSGLGVGGLPATAGTAYRHFAPNAAAAIIRARTSHQTQPEELAWRSPLLRWIRAR